MWLHSPRPRRGLSTMSEAERQLQSPLTLAVISPNQTISERPRTSENVFFEPPRQRPQSRRLAALVRGNSGFYTISITQCSSPDFTLDQWKMSALLATHVLLVHSLLLKWFSDAYRFLFCLTNVHRRRIGTPTTGSTGPLREHEMRYPICVV